MERVSCSDSCPGLFSQLKEVYLFGCNTLNPEALRSASAEVVRSLVRGGMPRADAERLARSLNAGHGESSRDRMRLVFKDVPEIYGFSSVAPLGPQAAATLGKYFQANGTGEVGSGRVNSRLLGQFSANSMVVTRGMTDADPHAAIRRDVCQFADERLSDAQRLRFIHQLLQRRMAEVRMYLDRIEAYAATLATRDRRHRTLRRRSRRSRATARRATAISILRAMPISARCACACSTSRRSSGGSRRPSCAPSSCG